MYYNNWIAIGFEKIRHHCLCFFFSKPLRALSFFVQAYNNVVKTISVFVVHNGRTRELHSYFKIKMS